MRVTAYEGAFADEVMRAAACRRTCVLTWRAVQGMLGVPEGERQEP